MMSAKESAPFIAIACGGTGGHLFPGLAVCAELQARGGSVALLVSPKDVDQRAVQSAADLEVFTLPAVALQRGSRLAFIRGFWQSWRASKKIFRSRRPQAVLAMGGFTSAPPIFAARSTGAKTFLHESNTIPGRANRWMAHFVDQAFVGFKSAAARLRVREVSVTGTPVRPAFRPRDPAACRAVLGFDAAKPVVLVMGGSQGASGINEIILKSLPVLAKRWPHWQWVHLTGSSDADKVTQGYDAFGLKALVRPFLVEMELALGAATVVVSRAGASSLAELAAMRVPSLLVPFPHAADDHQLQNAREFVHSGAAQLLEQKSATPGLVADELQRLVEDHPARKKIVATLAQWHSPRAAEQIAETILGAVMRSGVQARARRTSSGQSCSRQLEDKAVRTRGRGPSRMRALETSDKLQLATKTP